MVVDVDLYVVSEYSGYLWRIQYASSTWYIMSVHASDETPTPHANMSPPSAFYCIYKVSTSGDVKHLYKLNIPRTARGCRGKIDCTNASVLSYAGRNYHMPVLSAKKRYPPFHPVFSGSHQYYLCFDINHYAGNIVLHHASNKSISY